MTDQIEKRPSLYGKEVVAAVVEEVFPKVLEWLGDGAPEPDDEEDMQHVKEQVAEAIEHGMYEGYETTRCLDSRYSWSVDGELVDIFEEAGWDAYRAHDDLVEQWAIQNGIVPTLAVGDKVSFYSMGKDYHGEITEVRTKTAQYTIFCEEMGHVRTIGNVRSDPRSTGVIIPYEETKAAS